MKIASKKALALMISLLLFVFVATMVGLKPLADSSDGLSDESESAISSEEISSELESEEVSSDTTEGTSIGYSQSGLLRSTPPTVFSVTPGSSKSTYTTGGPGGVINIATGGVTLDNAFLTSGIGTEELNPNGFDPYTGISTQSTDFFKIPVIDTDASGVEYYTYLTYRFDNTSNEECLELIFAMEQLYPGCYNAWIAYMNSITVGSRAGNPVKVSDISGFMSSTGSNGFWTGYHTYLSSARATSGNQYFWDSYAYLLETTPTLSGNTFTIPISHGAADKKYYFDISSSECVDGRNTAPVKDIGIFYYLLGYSQAEEINIFGVSGGAEIWGVDRPSSPGYTYDAANTIVGYGTGAAANRLYERGGGQGTKTTLMLGGGSASTTISGYWGARIGLGGRTYGDYQGNAKIVLSSYNGPYTSGSGTAHTVSYNLSSFGGKYEIRPPADPNIAFVEIGGFSRDVGMYTSTGDVTTATCLREPSLASLVQIKVSPAVFGVISTTSTNTEVSIDTGRKIKFVGTGGTLTYTPSGDYTGSGTEATIPIAAGIWNLDCSSDSWQGIGLHDFIFNNTSMGNTTKGNFIFAGTVDESTVTIDNGALGGTAPAHPNTFILNAPTIGTLDINQNGAQVGLYRTVAKEVNFNGDYASFAPAFTGATGPSGPSTDIFNTMQATSADSMGSLRNSNYLIVTLASSTSGITSLPYIETLNIAGSGYDFSSLDLQYSEAVNIHVNDFSGANTSATIMLPDVRPVTSTAIHVTNTQLQNPITDEVKVYFDDTSSSLTELKLYGAKKLTKINFNRNPTLGNQLQTLDISSTWFSGTPGIYPPQLEVQPEIIDWTYAPTPPADDKELLVKDTAIKEFYSFANQSTTLPAMYPENVTLLDIRNINTPSQLERLDIPTGGYKFGSITPAALTTLKYKAGHDQTLKYLTLNGQNKIGTTGGAAAATISSTFSKDDDSGLVPGTPLAALEEVRYNELTQLVLNPVNVIDIDLSDNKIRIFEMSNCTPTAASDGYGVHDLNLSGNQFTVIDNLNSTNTATNGNGFYCVNTPILGTIDFSKNNLTKVSLDGTQSVSITGGTHNLGSTINLSNQLNTISIPELSATPFGNISDGVTVKEIDSLVTLDVRYDKITGFDLKDLANLKYIEGAAHHSFATITTPQLLIAGRASFDNAGPNLWPPAGTSGAKKELNFEGHAITYLTIQKMGDFDVLNFRRQNSTGDVAPKAEQGALQTVNLVAGTGGDIDTLDVSFNSIERVDNAGGALLSGTMNYTGVTFTGNAVVNADYNNISKVNIKGTQFVSGADTLKTLRMNDNLLIDLTYTDSASLEKLLVNRSVTGRNTFANGNVILTNASALEAFAPATSVAADKTEDAQFNRIKPVVPSESRWAQDSPGGITPLFGDFTDLASGTFGSEFGFYHSVPITTLDISGATSMTTLRVPGHYLTNSSMNSAGTGNIEFLDLSGSPYLTTDATGALYAGTSTTKSRGGKYTTINVRSAGTQDTNSGQLTGVFVGQWPKLQSLYIQNNQIQQLDVGTSTNLVHILAYQNQLGQGLTSDAVKVTTATALTVLDVERNPNIRVLAVPTQNLEILRAGLAGLTAYPNVHNITTLKQLYVDHNNLSGDAEEVAGNPNLEVLNISANNFTTLPNVSSLANLEEYYAYNNQAKSLGDFNNSGKLAILDVSDNLIESWPTLPSSIVYLDLSRNRFGGVLDIPGIPAGISRSTPYTVKAHEVTALEGVTDKGAVYTQTDDFYGTFAIEDNQITALPEALKNAYTDMINNVSGRLAYRMFVNWNVLDIDVYSLDSSGNPVAAYTGTQKWVAAYPGVKATLLNFIYDDKLKMVLEGSVGLYDPRSGLPVDDINGFEAPYSYQEWEYGWEDTLGLVYGEKIDRDGVALGKVRIIDNPGRNGRAIIGVTLYGPQMNTNSIKEWNEDGTKTVDGSQDSGQVLDDLKGNNANYNPATGALGNEE